MIEYESVWSGAARHYLCIDLSRHPWDVTREPDEAPDPLPPLRTRRRASMAKGMRALVLRMLPLGEPKAVTCRDVMRKLQAREQELAQVSNALNVLVQLGHADRKRVRTEGRSRGLGYRWRYWRV